ncbi:CRISPR-associated protein [Pyrodictium delaneyi]|uniref:CRISPR-associated protein n=1 Tax=Pyrodictium delaneyi TaxID=1273541 RepID=A0A0P0N398_9CREN|nr:type III-B CRISPR-associated protein Cas10/Cmr2 [Pyrodictium delaneyi]ALL01403.1 CRISPR-associated protein [Pyrodictium delaneyi]
MTRLEAVKLAILFHDPPWKPWTVLGRLPGLHERLYQVFRDSVNYALREAGCGSYEELKKSLRAHELQGALFLAVLAGELGRRRVGDATGVAFEALRLLCRRDSSVERADAFSSALDRLVVHAAENALGRKLGTNRLAYKNPFDPELVIVNSSAPSIDRLEEFVRVYASTVAKLVERACSAGGNYGCGLLLVHVATLLMEHLWYKVFPGQAPPADTRVPGHTVFDHVSAAMAMANWFSGARDGDVTPRGYLVVVDLASVQSWISEARRLRDMWAASWLASFLAWKSVEPLVERFGPDVLLQPPARLHPFYTAWLLSKLGFRRWSDLEKEARESRAVDVLHSVLEPWFQGWPIDPTVPSRVLIILPREAGTPQEVEKNIVSSYAAVWRGIIGELASYVEELVKVLKEGEVRKLLEQYEDGELRRELQGLRVLLRLAEARDIRELLEGLEPPLPLRITVVDVAEAYREYEEWLRECRVWDRARRRLGGGDDDYAVKVLEGLRGDRDLLFYAFLQLVYLPREEKEALIRASRRSGKGYLDYAQSMYNTYLGTIDKQEKVQPRLCTVCGRAVALINPPEPGSRAYEKLTRVIDEMRRSSGEAESATAARLLAEARGERLCPYCLVKRMLRTMLQGIQEAGKKGIAGQLVGLELEESHREKLVASSVDAYTSRLHVNRAKLAEALKKFIGGLSVDDLRKLYSLVTSGHLSYGVEKWLEEDKRKELIKIVRDKLQEDEEAANINTERLVGALESSVPSLLVDAGLRNSVANAYAAGDIGARLIKALDEAAGYGSAYYAVVAADGDFMGRGVLQGRLGVEPHRYMETLLEVADPEARRAIAEAFAALVDALDEVLRRPEAGGGEQGYRLGCPERRLTLVVTPSYHYTVSRALAASAVMDRAIVEVLGGFLVYAGGDDLVAILPPGTGDPRERGVPYPALAAAIAARRSYWGLKAYPNGFHVYVPGGNGDHREHHRPLGVVVPAIRGAGRSTVVYYAHAKTPMWLAFRTAHELLDAKDSIAYLEYGGSCLGGVARCKDALIVASEVSGVAVLPFTLGLEPGGGDAGLTGALVKAILFSIEECGAKSYELALSASVIRDLTGDTRLLAELAERDMRAALSLIEHYLMRNCCERSRCKKPGEEDEYAATRRLAAAAQNELDKVADILGSRISLPDRAREDLINAVASVAVATEKDSMVAAILENSGLAVELCECLVRAPLASMVFHAAGVTRTAARRPPRRKEGTTSS